MVIHEAHHKLYRAKNLEAKFDDALIRNNATKEWHKVSEYASSKVEELFTETGTALELGIDIPLPIKKAFQETIEGL